MSSFLHCTAQFYQIESSQTRCWFFISASSNEINLNICIVCRNMHDKKSMVRLSNDLRDKIIVTNGALNYYIWPQKKKKLHLQSGGWHWQGVPSGFIKNALWSLRQFLATQSPAIMMKNAFYFTLKAFFVHKIFKFLSFWSCIKTAWLESKVNFELFDVISWLTSNCNKHNAQ